MQSSRVGIRDGRVYLLLMAVCDNGRVDKSYIEGTWRFMRLKGNMFAVFASPRDILKWTLQPSPSSFNSPLSSH